MEITLALLLYFIRDLEPVTVKELENARYFLGAQQYWKNEIFQANKLKQNDIIFQKDEDYQYLYVARLSEILEDAESLHADMAILASADRACEEDQLKKIPGGLILVSGKYGVPYVLNRMINIFRFLTEWDKTMHIAALEGKNVQEMLNLSAEILEYPMTVFDSGFNVLAYTSALPTIETHFQETIRNGYTNAYTMSLVRQQRIFSKLEKQPLIVAPAVENPELQNVYMAFAADGNVLGYGYIFPNRTEIEMGYLDLLKIFIANLTFCLQREYEHQRFGQMLYETLLLNLMKPSGISPEQLSEQLKNIDGLEAEGCFALGVLEFEETENVPLPFLARQIARAMWDVRPFLYEDKICMLKIMKTGSRSWNGFSQQEELNLSHVLDNYSYRFGVSNEFYQIMELPAAFHQAQAALNFGKKEKRSVCRYADYYYFDLFASMETQMPLEHLKMGLYRKLQEYDLQNQTRYCSQILMYLKCDCNATHAAEQMYLHRNTVRKAVQFVEDTWQVELRDTEIKKQMVMGELVDQYLAWKNR